MARYAAYDVVADKKKTLNFADGDAINSQHDFTLDFASTVDFGMRSVMSYMVHPSASGVKYEMYVTNLLSNGSLETELIVPSTSLPSQTAFVRQEVISGNTFKKVNATGLGVHHLRIKVTGGSAKFSDIVHMYLVNS